jgi:hypothetical protein
VVSLIAISIQSGITTFGAISQLMTTGSYEGNVIVVGGSCVVSLISLLVLGYGVALAPPPPKKEEVRPSEKRRTAGAKRQQKHYTAYKTSNLQLVASLLASPIIPTLWAIRFAHRRRWLE